jgi:hypothetical protein
MGKGGPTPALGSPPDEGSLAQTLKASLGTPTGPVCQAQGPVMELAAITGQPGSNTDW